MICAISSSSAATGAAQRLVQNGADRAVIVADQNGGIVHAAPSSSGEPAAHASRPFHDQQYPGGPQTIPGKVQCAYYDLGGEGVETEPVGARDQTRLEMSDGGRLDEPGEVELRHARAHVVHEHPAVLVGIARSRRA